MDNTKKLDSGRFVAMIMLGGGLFAVGLMFLLIFNNKTNGVSNSSSNLSAVPMEMDYQAPELNLVTLDNTPVSLKDFQGSVVLVNLWATWCPPCRQEMPTLNAFYDQYKDQDFVLIAINQEETHNVVQSFVKEYGLSFPIWLDKDYLAEREFKTMSLPSSYLVGRDGRIRLLWIGAISRENLEKYVPKIIME